MLQMLKMLFANKKVINKNRNNCCMLQAKGSIPYKEIGKFPWPFQKYSVYLQRIKKKGTEL